MRGALALAGYWNGAKDSTATPKWLYDILNSEFNFDFDPCPLNPTFDGLNVDWGKSNYVNPPYSNKVPWIERSVEERFRRKRTVVLLLPVDTSAKWYQQYLHPFASQIRFLRHRLMFPPNKSHAAYASMVVVFDNTLPEERFIVWDPKK